MSGDILCAFWLSFIVLLADISRGNSHFQCGRFERLFLEGMDMAMKRNKKIKLIKGIPWYKTIIFKMAVVLLITLLPSIVLFLNLYKVFQKETMQHIADTAFSRDKQIFSDFYSQIEDMELYALNLDTNADLCLLSDMWNEYSVDKRNQKISRVQENLQWYRVMQRYVLDIKIYFMRNNICLGANYWTEMKAEDQRVVDEYFENPQSLKKSNGSVNLFVVHSFAENPSPNSRFLYQMKISGYNFQKLMTQINSDGMAECVVLINGEPLMNSVEDADKLELMLEEYDQYKNEKQDASFEIRQGKERYFCSGISGGNHRIDLLICRSYDDVFGQSEKMMFTIPLLIGANLFVIIFFLCYVSRFIRRPVMTLNEAFSRMKSGEERVVIKEQSGSEFQDVYEGFNEMSQQLADNIQENYLSKINLQREQLKHLQAQINPHFLYNTLLFIKIRIRKKDMEGASRLAGLLSEYFRFMNRNRKDVIPLAEEMGCIMTYMNIQMERFSNRFFLQVDPCPEDMENIPVPRLLLQPLVENAVKYGVERVEKDGKIHVFFREDQNKLFFIIEESGVMIGEEEVENMNDRIQNPPEDTEITSTININRRIKLFYGEDCELRFERTPSGDLLTIAELKRRRRDEKVECCGG